MKTVKSCILLLAVMMIAAPVFSLDYGTMVPLRFGTTENVTLWKTDWSPDGKWIAFGGDEDIWIVSTETGEMKNLTADIDDRCSVPEFTPDGSAVTYSRMIVDSETKQARCKIESIDIDSEKRMTFMNEAFAGTLSQDGSLFVYIYWPDPEKKENMTYAVYDFGTQSPINLGIDFHNGEPIFNFGHSSISPDNTNFVTTLIEPSENRDASNMHAFYRIFFDGRAPEMILNDADPWYPKYSPDSKWILYTRHDYTDMDTARNLPARDMYVFNTETGESTNLLPDNPYGSLCGSWSPDGSKICYILDKNGEYELYIRNFEFYTPVDDGLQLGVDEQSPMPFALRGNYPNPFNPTTTIEFSLPDAGQVNLTVYNAAGQKIRDLVSGMVNTGVHSVVWNGRDNTGAPVSAGVYFSRLEMNGQTATGRMILVK
ncbi:T9SS type A sorting domain-containing protein [bacterium]|nr:T9SS type A sorting domain-containing protein [bacterium]